MGQTGSYYGNNNKDGDWTQILYDRNGALSGTSNSYIVRADNGLLNTGSCSPLNGVSNAAVCTGNDYGQVCLMSLY